MQIAHIGEHHLYQLPRVKRVQTLDFGHLNLDRVLDVTTQIEPEQIAVALVDEPSIRMLKAALNVGQAKAMLIRNFAKSLLSALRERGYGVYPVPECVS